MSSKRNFYFSIYVDLIYFKKLAQIKNRQNTMTNLISAEMRVLYYNSTNFKTFVKSRQDNMGLNQSTKTSQCPTVGQMGKKCKETANLM